MVKYQIKLVILTELIRRIMLKIYHNPRCSKSRNAVEYLNDNNHDYETILYLQTPPTGEELKDIVAKLKLNVRDIIRVKESEYKESNLSDKTLSDDQIINILTKNPKLIERPIIVANDKACIARPIDNLINMLND